MGSNTKRNDDIVRILEDIASGGRNYIDGDESKRKHIIGQARKLCWSLETPSEAVLRLAWEQNATTVALRVALDLDIFNHLVGDAGKGRSSSQIAAVTKAERSLVVRILNQLAAVGIIFEAGADLFTPTPLAYALTDPKFRDGVPFIANGVAPSFHCLPKFLAETGYKDPIDAANSPFQYSFNTKLHFFEYLEQHPNVLNAFKNHMVGYASGRNNWADPDFYPVKERLGQGACTDAQAVMLVDVGGNLGRDVAIFHKRHPELPGRLICQDQGSVICDAPWRPEIELMVHDFFQEQPVKGARAYYLHSCLHDWPDDKCREILLALKPAMTPGYSKLLINENVIPSRDVHWLTTSLDWIMMAAYASRERTEENWRAILDSVGMKCTGIWTHSPGTESLIEAIVE